LYALVVVWCGLIVAVSNFTITHTVGS
jgi:hypothetical protein